MDIDDWKFDAENSEWFFEKNHFPEMGVHANGWKPIPSPELFQMNKQPHLDRYGPQPWQRHSETPPVDPDRLNRQTHFENGKRKKFTYHKCWYCKRYRKCIYKTLWINDNDESSHMCLCTNLIPCTRDFYELVPPQYTRKFHPEK